MIYRRWGKRWLDVTLAITALVVLAPVLLVVAVIIRLRLGAPVLFRQVRAGKNGEPFMIVKFRTMTDQRDLNGALLPDEQRMTAFGRRLRRTSLDEVPELFNVIRGEMSLVGPRPLFMHYLPLYTAEQARRHEVKPGITGLAQVRGRNWLKWEDRFMYDVEYVNHVSFVTDTLILGWTVKEVLAGSGISEAGHATAQEFGG